jgi:hypothetical protein
VWDGVRFESYLIGLLPDDGGRGKGNATVPVEVSNQGYGTFLQFPDGTAFLVRMGDKAGVSEVFRWDAPVPQPLEGHS